MLLSKKWVDKIVSLPESGMGYQFVDIHLRNGNVVSNVIVLDCKKISADRALNFTEVDITDITTGSAHS